MELTGKCKTDFEKWWGENHYMDFCDDKVYLGLDNFYKQSFSMQYGVLVDFFEFVGYDLEITSSSVLIFSNRYVMYSDKEVIEGIVYESETKNRPEARTKAIEKANEIYNEKI